MPHTFESPRSYHPSDSVLGRAVRAWVGDRLRGEALFIVVLTGLSLALLMIHYLGWAFLKPTLLANPSWQVLFWGGQVGSVLALIGVGLVGFRPAVRVECQSDAVTLTQGDRSCTISNTSVEDVALIPARQYHRHYRRYAATRVFASRLPDEVIRLHTPEGPVIVALSDPDAQAALLDRLEALHAPSPEPVAKAQP
ncbi:MAG: hypothetical protein BRD42_08175 [Bacteroidetes bacterium QS_3_64_15]|nr:MAG: hypothetical protein BRD42_08175 [Bacteroidetes bacterium QS_3_64_15]